MNVKELAEQLARQFDSEPSIELMIEKSIEFDRKFERVRIVGIEVNGEIIRYKVLIVFASGFELCVGTVDSRDAAIRIFEAVRAQVPAGTYSSASDVQDRP